MGVHSKMMKKKIKIVSRGIVFTSRGRCITPTGIFYESVDSILKMITRDRAKIVEILDDNTQVELTVKNFDKDNSKVTAIPTPVKEEPKQVAKVEPVTPSVNGTGEKPLSRKERKKLEQQKRSQEATNKNTEPVEPVKEATPNVDSKEETPSTEVPSDAIEA